MSGKTHARSSSLDLAQLNKRAGVHPPFLPPRRTSPGTRALHHLYLIKLGQRMCKLLLLLKEKM